MIFPFSNGTQKNVTLDFLYQEDNRILPYQLKPIIANLSQITVVPNRTKYRVPIVAEDVGELVIHLNSSSSEISE